MMDQLRPGRAARNGQADEIIVMEPQIQTLRHELQIEVDAKFAAESEARKIGGRQAAGDAAFGVSAELDDDMMLIDVMSEVSDQL